MRLMNLPSCSDSLQEADLIIINYALHLQISSIRKHRLDLHEEIS
jgi:hypothetical protein